MPHRSRRSRSRWAALGLGLFCSITAVAQTSDAGAGLNDPSAIRVLLAADLETTLSSQMNGTLGELHADLGQQVAKGALLAQMNCSEAQARARVAEAQLKMATQNLQAKQSMRKLDAVGDLEVDTAKTDMQKAAGERSLAVTQRGYCSVRAPFSARIVKIYVKPYQTLAAGTPMFDLVSDGNLKIRLNVPSNLMQQLKPGMSLKVRIHETGKTYAAHISAVNGRVDAVAQTIELEARFDEPQPELIAGMSGIALLPAPANE